MRAAPKPCDETTVNQALASYCKVFNVKETDRRYSAVKSLLRVFGGLRLEFIDTKKLIWYGAQRINKVQRATVLRELNVIYAAKGLHATRRQAC